MSSNCCNNTFFTQLNKGDRLGWVTFKPFQNFLFSQLSWIGLDLKVSRDFSPQSDNTNIWQDLYEGECQCIVRPQPQCWELKLYWRWLSLSSLSDKPRVVDTIDTGGDLSNTPDLGGDMMATGRALSSGDEAWVVPMLVISAISVSVITIYQVSNIIIIKRVFEVTSSCSRLSSSSVRTDPVLAEDTYSCPKCCS